MKRCPPRRAGTLPETCSPRGTRWPQAKGFTLVELLAVMGVAAILLAVTVPAVSSLGNARGVDNAVTSLSLLLGQCRSYAMARNTYVWVGFAPNAATQQMTVGVVAGRTGQADDLNAATTYAPIYRLQTFDNLALGQFTDLTGPAAQADQVSASNIGTFSQSVGPATTKFTSIIQFDSAGEARIKTGVGTAHWIQVGLQPVRGGNATNPNVAVLQIGTLTGQVEVFRR